MMRFLLVWSPALALGCAPVHKRPVEPVPAPAVMVVPAPPTDSGSPLVAVLSNIGRLVTLPQEEQRTELVRLTDNFTRSGLPSDRLRLALLLVLGDPAIRDHERAKAMLEVEAWEDLAYETLARLALDLADERRRHARDRLDASAALDEERKLREELEARLRAVEQIEDEMNTREVGGGDASQAEDPVR
jgi:hypothetical protein